MSDENDQGYVEIHPEAERFPYLQMAGTYGPGQPAPFEAECVVMKYDCPASEPPPWDRDEKQAKRSDYAHFLIKVNSTDYGTNFIEHWEPIGANSGSRLPAWLTSLGVPLGPNFGHRPAQVPGTKCSVKVGEPSKGKNERMRSGRLQDILGA